MERCGAIVEAGRALASVCKLPQFGDRLARLGEIGVFVQTAALESRDAQSVSEPYGMVGSMVTRYRWGHLWFPGVPMKRVCTMLANSLVGSDLVLMLLWAPTTVESANGRVNGITRLEKLLYLVERETSVAEGVAAEQLKFKAYKYGPFSKDVYEAVELLEESGLLVEQRVVDGQTIDSMEDISVTGAVEVDEYVERRFVLTDNGRLVADHLARHHPSIVKQLTTIKDRYAGRSLSGLIRYVYKSYPESAEQSTIAHRFS